MPVLTWEGNDLPVSKFEAGGYVRSPGNTRFEKRNIGINVPKWLPDKCT